MNTYLLQKHVVVIKWFSYSIIDFYLYASILYWFTKIDEHLLQPLNFRNIKTKIKWNRIITGHKKPKWLFLIHSSFLSPLKIRNQLLNQYLMYGIPSTPAQTCIFFLFFIILIVNSFGAGTSCGGVKFHIGQSQL